MNRRTAASRRKRTKFAEAGPVDPISPLTGVMPCATPNIVHVTDDPLPNVAIDVEPPRRQYLTRSRGVVTTNTGQQARQDGVGSSSTKSSPMADSRLQGSNDDSTASSSL